MVNGLMPSLSMKTVHGSNSAAITLPRRQRQRQRWRSSSPRTAVNASDKPVKSLNAVMRDGDNEVLGAPLIRELNAACLGTAQEVLDDEIIQRAIQFGENESLVLRYDINI